MGVLDINKNIEVADEASIKWQKREDSIQNVADEVIKHYSRQTDSHMSFSVVYTVNHEQNNQSLLMYPRYGCLIDAESRKHLIEDLIDGCTTRDFLEVKLDWILYKIYNRYEYIRY